MTDFDALANFYDLSAGRHQDTAAQLYRRAADAIQTGDHPHADDLVVAARRQSDYARNENRKAHLLRQGALR